MAQSGSIIYMMNDAYIDLLNPTMSYGKARQYGGAVYSGGGVGTRSPAVTPTLKIRSCTSVQSYFDSKINGGFLYANNPLL